MAELARLLHVASLAMSRTDNSESSVATGLLDIIADWKSDHPHRFINERCVGHLVLTSDTSAVSFLFGCANLV